MRFTRSLAAAAALAALLAVSVPARAHTTTIDIVASQMRPSGIVHGYGIAPDTQTGDAPVTNGYVRWRNLDPVAYRIAGGCVGGYCMTFKPELRPRFDVVVGATGGIVNLADLPLGEYAYAETTRPYMRGAFTVEPHAD